MKKNYTDFPIKAYELDQFIDISIHSDQQCEIFSNNLLEKTKRMIEKNMRESIRPIGYRNSENKIVLVEQGRLFCHLLALYFPLPMKIDASRTTLQYIDQFNVSDITSTMKYIKAERQLIKEGRSESDMELFLFLVEIYLTYEVVITLYDTKELAHLATEF